MIYCELLCRACHGVPAVDDLRLEEPKGDGVGLIEVSKVCTSAGILAHGTLDEPARTTGDERVVIHIETHTHVPDPQSSALIATVDIKSLEAKHPDIEDVFLSYSHATEEVA